MNNEFYGANIYTTEYEDIYHAGKKGMKWGFNDGKRNGGRIAETVEQLQNMMGSRPHPANDQNLASRVKSGAREFADNWRSGAADIRSAYKAGRRQAVKLGVRAGKYVDKMTGGKKARRQREAQRNAKIANNERWKGKAATQTQVNNAKKQGIYNNIFNNPAYDSLDRHQQVVATRNAISAKAAADTAKRPNATLGQINSAQKMSKVEQNKRLEEQRRQEQERLLRKLMTRPGAPHHY